MFSHTIRTLLKNIDLFKVPILFRSTQRTKVATGYFGILCFLIIAVIIYLFSLRVGRILKFDESEVQSTHYLTRIQNRSMVQNFMFAIKIQFDYKDELQSQNGSNSSVLDFFEINPYTLSGGALDRYGDLNLIQMVPCTLEQWRLMNWQIDPNFNFENYFCLPSLVTTSTAQYQKKFLKLEILKCTTKPNCKSFQQINKAFYQHLKIHRQLTVSVAFKSPFLSIYQKNPFKFGIQQFNFLLTYDIRQNIIVQFDQLQVTTDYSIWPFYKQQETVKDILFSQIIQSFEPSLSEQPNKLLKLSMSLTNDSELYFRKITKIDEALSFAGVFFGIVILFLKFALRPFNQYRYELYVAENSFNYDWTGYKIKESSLGIFRYIKYRLYLLFSLISPGLCYQEKLEQMKNTLEEGRKILDTEILLWRINLIERYVENLYDENYLKVLTLMKPQIISQAKNKRLILSYYDKIITKINDVATVKDMYLKVLSQKIIRKKGKINKTQILKKSKYLIEAMNAEESEIKFNEDESKEKQLIQLQIKESLKKNLNLYFFQQTCQQISEYPLIAFNAKQVILEDQYIEVEKQLAQSFINLNQDDKRELIQKIPLKILHRLRLVNHKEKLPEVTTIDQNKMAKLEVEELKSTKNTIKSRKIRKSNSVLLEQYDMNSIEVLIPVERVEKIKNTKKMVKNIQIFQNSKQTKNNVLRKS